MTRRDPFQAIADPTRRAIIGMIAKESMNLNSVAEKFSVSRPAISKHIRILTECGLIKIRQKGRERFCEAKLEGLNDVSKWLADFNQPDEMHIENTVVETPIVNEAETITIEVQPSAIETVETKSDIEESAVIVENTPLVTVIEIEEDAAVIGEEQPANDDISIPIANEQTTKPIVEVIETPKKEVATEDKKRKPSPKKEKSSNPSPETNTLQGSLFGF